MLRRLAPLVLLLALALPARAQAPAVLSDSARVALLTILPGDEAWSLFGHSAFRVYDPATGYDATYNYGTFDFGEVLPFLARFAYGELDYFLSVQSFPHVVEHYRRVEGRPVIEQALALTPAQVQQLYHFLEVNARPENRYYRYDFFFDNCSTRLRDVLVAVLGEDVRFTAAPDPGRSFRQLIDPYAAGHPALDLGMDLGLGLPADREASAWEAMFLPIHLMQAFDYATVGSGAAARPLVTRTDTVAWVDGYATAEPAWPWPALGAWLLFLLGFALTVHDVRSGRRQRRLFDGLLFGLAGLAGLVIVFLWFISLHAVTHGNLNLLWAWPTHGVASVALVRRAQGRGLGVYLALAAVAALAVVVGWPLWPQSLPVPILPLVLLLAVRSGALAWFRLARARAAA